MNAMTSGKPIFINYTSDLLVNPAVRTFPPNIVRIVIQNSLAGDEKAMKACLKLSELGFHFVFEDFVLSQGYETLLKIAKVIKIDFARFSDNEREAFPLNNHLPDVQFMAENVETHEDFQAGVKYGFEFFHGRFLNKPDINNPNKLPGYHQALVDLLTAINDPDIDFDHLETLVKKDIAISYQLLDYINSAFFGFTNKIRSIKHALALLGLEEVRKWLSVTALANVTDEKTRSLIQTSLTRAHFMERLAKPAEKSESVMFLIGLFSLIDAFLDRPMQDVLQNLPLAEDIKATLLGEQTEMRKLLDLAIAYEDGDWAETQALAKKMNIPESEMADRYPDAVEATAKVLEFYND
jgi:EAL and modified HD-GYP domain-containing signal transduction protein